MRRRRHDHVIPPGPCNCNGQNANASCLHLCGLLYNYSTTTTTGVREHVPSHAICSTRQAWHNGALRGVQGIHVKEEPPTADSMETQVGIPAIRAVWGSP